MAITQLSIFMENRFGMIRKLTKILGDNGIDIRALSVTDTEGFGVLRMIVSDTKKAKDVLSMEECIVSTTPVLGVVIPDVPGGLSSVLTTLAEHKINIEYLYAFITRKGTQACVVIHVKENTKAVKVLTEAGITLLSDYQVPLQ